MSKRSVLNEHYVRRGIIIRVIDGDTVVVRVDLGYHITIEETFRLKGIDAYEIRRGKWSKGLSKEATDRKLALGHQAKDFLEEITWGKSCVLRSFRDEKGKYGRYIADLYVVGDKVSVNDQLVNKKLAKYKKY